MSPPSSTFVPPRSVSTPSNPGTFGNSAFSAGPQKGDIPFGGTRSTSTPFTSFSGEDGSKKDATNGSHNRGSPFGGPGSSSTIPSAASNPFESNGMKSQGSATMPSYSPFGASTKPSAASAFAAQSNPFESNRPGGATGAGGMPSAPKSLSNFGGMSSFSSGSDSPFGKGSSSNIGNYGNLASSNPFEPKANKPTESESPYAAQSNPFESNGNQNSRGGSMPSYSPFGATKPTAASPFAAQSNPFESSSGAKGDSSETGAMKMPSAPKSLSTYGGMPSFNSGSDSPFGNTVNGGSS